jgi:hypothetical protein
MPLSDEAAERLNRLTAQYLRLYRLENGGLDHIESHRGIYWTGYPGKPARLPTSIWGLPPGDPPLEIESGRPQIQGRPP